MPIITISRGTLSGGRQLAESLNRRLGLQVVTQEEVVSAASRYGIPVEDLARGLDALPNLWDKLTHRKHRFLLAAQAVLLEMVEDGQAIYEGLAGAFLLAGLPRVVKIRLIAPHEARVRSAMTALGLNREEAVRHIDSVDDRRARLARHLFGVEEHDPGHYDLVINLTQMGLETAAELVVGMVGREELRDTPHSLQEVKDLALRTRVVAELQLCSPFDGEEIEVSVDNGTVVLGGAGLAGHRREVVQLVRGIRGVTTVIPEEQDEPPHPGAPLLGKDQVARDVMLPPDRYPTVHQWVSLRDAIVALSVSSVRLDEEHIVHPRYLLVLDEADRLAGIVSRRELLRGLAPQYREAQVAEEHIRELVGFGGGGADELIKWTSLLSGSAIKAADQPVSTVVATVKGVVNASTPLSEVVTRMIRDRVDLAPVVENGKVIGIVLMSNIFDIVAEFIMEHGAPARRPSEQ